jgi:hypothetical protein
MGTGRLGSGRAGTGSRDRSTKGGGLRVEGEGDLVGSRAAVLGLKQRE